MKSHNCMICHETFSHTGALAAHVKLHYPHQKNFTCPKCSAVCLIEKDLHVHISQLNKCLDVPDLTNNDLCISSELTCT